MSNTECGLHCELRLISSCTHLVLVPTKSTTPSTAKRILVFDRLRQSILLQDFSESLVREYASVAKTSPDAVVYGILGLVNLSNHLYIIMIRERALVALIDGHAVHKLVEPVIVRIAYDSSEGVDGKNAERPYRKLLKPLENYLKTRDFYFSYTFDISRCLMKKDDGRSGPFWSRWEDRFFCNRVIVSLLVERELHEWIVPMMRGAFQNFSMVLDGRRVDMYLISRRSRFRDGTRYNVRGIDQDGHAANFVETEQVVLAGGHWLSFTQTRGSVPIQWEQTGKKFYPVPKIDPDVERNARLFSKHFSDQIRHYGPHCIVNLLSRRGIEQGLNSAYKFYAENCTNRLRYLAFDFNECYRRDAGSIGQVTHILSPHLRDIGFHHQDGRGVIRGSQRGIIRTNCLDCLDRTNLVQSQISRQVVMHMLDCLRISLTATDVELLERVLQEAWGNNGDAISFQYAGTEALKGDLTRTGKRKPSGLVKDSVNSISRYYMGQFKDTSRQVAIDILNGSYTTPDQQLN